MRVIQVKFGTARRAIPTSCQNARPQRPVQIFLSRTPFPIQPVAVMPPASSPDQARPLPSWIVAAVCLLGLAAVGFSALDLSAHGLAYYINSDFLTPYFFCSDLISGRYPISGWTLSASPYFVPDHLVLSGLLAGFGRTGLAYALFTLVFYPALFVLAGFCVKTAVGRAGPAFVAALLLGNVFLALRLLPGHARCLWWIGAPTCHGGVLLLGFGYLWMLGAGLWRGNVGRLPVGLFFLGFVGLLSDSLFLFQVVLPASVALFLGRRRYPHFMSWLRWQGACGAAALLCTQLFKPLCNVAGWFYFSRIIRVAPTPSNQWHALGQFVSDLPSLLHDNWGFTLPLVAAAVLMFRSLRKMPPPLSANPSEGNCPRRDVGFLPGVLRDEFVHHAAAAYPVVWMERREQRTLFI